ncbi:MAG: hypothetical protein ABS882_02315 [Lysinibacillus sp.]
MKNVWKPLLLASMLTIMLAGCSAPVAEQIEKGLVGAEMTFASDAMETTDEVGDIEVYMPRGYEIVEGSVDMNYVVSKGYDQYILFVNTIEEENSQLHYDNLMSELGDKVIEEQTYRNDGVFGFSAVVEHAEDKYELIVSNGGIKMSTMSADKKIDDKLQAMMEIVRSVKVK